VAASKVKSVILLSGGLDSSANLAFCDAWDEPVLALTADYGQRAFEPEKRAARDLCRHYGIKHETIDLRWLGALGGSSLTSTSQDVPDMDPAMLDDARTTQASAKAVWVPNRNGVLINVASAYAERAGANRVIVGFNIEEAATFPDNSAAYLDAATHALKFSTANHVAVHCYTTHWDKRRIVAELKKLEKPFPFEGVWSCYQGGNTPCGVCESCRRLKRALGSA
jgi:7-cyano-7-deazaguanine synthase